MYRTIIEPFKIKVVEPIALLDRETRLRHLRDADFNLFRVPAEAVTFDFLTDSGISAMSVSQWAAMMMADESYAGSRSFFRFEKAVRDLTGYKFIIPTHQGRAAERILFALTVKRGSVIPSNCHFDTTRANIEFDEGTAVDLVIREGLDAENEHPFKGNIDIERLRACCREHRGNIPLGMLTITNNSGGGQPASLENVRQVADGPARERHPVHPGRVPVRRELLVHQAARAWPVGPERRARSPGKCSASPMAARSAERRTASSTWEASSRSTTKSSPPEARNLLILTEGFPTYGGCAARDLEALAVGIEEAQDEEYLAYRCGSVRYLARGLNEAGIPTVQPPGGHAVYIDARRLLPHIPADRFPGQALACELYLEGGIRSCEIGSVMFGKEVASGEFEPAKMELVRLAMPRRVYTQSHVDRVIEIAAQVAKRAPELQGLRMTYRPPFLPHFSARFEPDV